jgi:hypothetical protein
VGLWRDVSEPLPLVLGVLVLMPAAGFCRGSGVLEEEIMRRIITGSIAVLALSTFAASCGGGDVSEGIDAGTDSGTDTDTDSDTDTDPCADAEEVMQPGPAGGPEIPTGIEHCSDDSWHRYAALECTPRDYECTSDFDECDDSECPEGQVCSDLWWGEILYCGCVTPCAIDADCGDEQSCLCVAIGEELAPSVCVSADCRADADCGDFECGVWDGMHCRTETDECHGNDDCEIDEFCGYDCTQALWKCTNYYVAD